MIVYEVNLFVQRKVEAEFRVWLDEHVRRIVALPGFFGAQVWERLDPPPAVDELVLCTSYHLANETALSNYLREHSAAMRAEGVQRFGNAFRAERRVLAQLATY